jgi:hypothetical protein
MRKTANTDYHTKGKPYLLPNRLKALYSYRIDLLFITLLLILSIFYFRDILQSDTLLTHADHRYALTVNEHLFHHLNDLPIHAAKLPFLSVLYLLQFVVGDQLAPKVFIILALFLATTLVYFANKRFIIRFQGKGGYWLSTSCFIGSLVIMYNPWTINKIHHHYWLVLSLAASYMLIAVIDSYIRSKERNNVNQFLLVGFSASLAASQPQSAIIYFLPMLAIYLISNLIFHRQKILSIRTAKKIGILIVITVACNLFWLVPIVQVLTTDRLSQGTGVLYSEGSQGFVTYGIVQENLDQLSRRATIENVLTGTSDPEWEADSSRDPSLKIGNIDLWEGLAFLPLSFIFLFFFMRSPIGKDITYMVVFFIALVILSVILATGSYYNDIYNRIFLDLPFGEAIRESYKFLGLYFLAASFFASASLYKLDRKSLKKNIVISLLIAGLILSWGWVGLTGNLNGHLTEALLPYPHDLANVSEYLHREYETNSSQVPGRIFWYPGGEERIQLQYSSVPELSTGSLSNLELPPYQLNYINELITTNDTSFIPLLEYLGVQYLVIREDFVDNQDNLISPYPLQDMKRRVQDLKTLLHENIVFESGRFGVYKLNNDPPISVSHGIYSGTDDLSKVVQLVEEKDYLNNIKLGPFLDDASLMILSDSQPPEPSQGAISVVNPASEHHMPGSYWSVGAINGGWLNTITPYFNNFGINTWQFDYNTGFIFTWGEGLIPSDFTVENTKPFAKFDFNSADEISQWQSNQPKNQALEHERNAMRVILNSSNYGWKTITSPTIPVSDDRVYVAKFGIRYDNAEGIHLKLTEHGKNSAIINNAIVQNIGSGTSDWQDIVFSYRPSSNEVTGISLSLWHGHLTRQPLPNILWIDDVGIYELSDDQLIENSITVPFQVDGNKENNDYKLFIRYLESPQGGLMNAILEDGSLIQIDTLSPHSRLVWRDLGEYTLNQGKHSLEFINEEGFNAVNSVFLIQTDQFEATKGQIQNWLNRNSSTALYIFEGESDMNGNSTIIKREESFDGNEMILVNNTLWTQFDVKKEGNYKIWIKGSGIFNVVVNDQKEVVNATLNGPTFSNSFELKQGDARLEISPLQGLANVTRNNNLSEDGYFLDSIWLVSDSNNRLNELSEDNEDSNISPSPIYSVTTTTPSNLWSSQEYEFKLNSTITKPLMISLAEPYNSNLKAEIYTTNGFSEVHNLIPLFYSLKSGIYIDSLDSGAKIVIYDASTPLQWFTITSSISLMSYIVLILSTRMKLIARLKRFAYSLNRHLK